MGSFWGKLTNGSDAFKLQPQPEVNREKLEILERAQQTIRFVAHITEAYVAKVELLLARDGGKISAAERREIETTIRTLIDEWEEKIRALGGEPKGLWKADFDSGDGYFCWGFPDRQIRHWHRYADGFTKRVAVEGWLSLS